MTTQAEYLQMVYKNNKAGESKGGGNSVPATKEELSILLGMLPDDTVDRIIKLKEQITVLEDLDCSPKAYAESLKTIHSYCEEFERNPEECKKEKVHEYKKRCLEKKSNDKKRLQQQAIRTLANRRRYTSLGLPPQPDA